MEPKGSLETAEGVKVRSQKLAFRYADKKVQGSTEPAAATKSKKRTSSKNKKASEMSGFIDVLPFFGISSKEGAADRDAKLHLTSSRRANEDYYIYRSKPPEAVGRTKKERL